MPESIDLNLIRAALREKYSLKENQQQRLITISASSIKESLNAAQEALAQSDLDTLSEYTHKIKGTLLILSLDDWAAKADKIHSAAGQGKAMDYEARLREIRTALKELCELECSESGR